MDEGCGALRVGRGGKERMVDGKLGMRMVSF
jgi:hypothetical protein